MEKLIETTKIETMKRLKTDRLLLREIRPDDVDAVFNCWMQDENVSRYMYWKASKNIEDAQDFVSFKLGNLKNDTWNRWMIVRESTQEMTGTCLLFFNDDEDHWDISYNQYAAEEISAESKSYRIN